jgi:CDP-diacylglycerol--serine O-phosphatidyltransferase
MRAPRPPRRETLQRGVIILPSAFTLGNLFFGIYAMVATQRGDLIWAGWCIMFAGTLDMLDGRIARFTRTGSRFGAELDSLVDAISFGVAPALIMYELYFADTNWSWLISYVFVTAIVVRLARFNVEQGGEAKKYFHGLPSPAGGMFLASFYPFSQTPFFAEYLADLPWHQIMAVATVLVGILTVSHIPYAKVPRIGVRTARGMFNTALVLACLFAALTIPRYYFFTFLLLYIAWGLVESALLGLLERLPGGDPLADEEDEETASRGEVRDLDYGALGPHAPAPAEGADDDQPQEEQA